ncbi:hypothetical protein BZZ01_20590 [Nostocales cyanobacterium HT-58-2]|nr:hypothetical protein BZZ01_20590 [Nostocales cyanobacterium HT-58-2]
MACTIVDNPCTAPPPPINPNEIQYTPTQSYPPPLTPTVTKIPEPGMVLGIICLISTAILFLKKKKNSFPESH